MRGISSYLAIIALFVAVDELSAQRPPAQKADTKDNGLVLVTKGVGNFVKIANGKLQLKYKEGDKDKTIDLGMAPQVMVRVKNPPVAFDSKGRLKKYTQEELDELKGEDKKEWGFEAGLNDLKPNQVIQVWLYRAKTAARTEQPIVGKIYINE
ncbi:MAG: hypothetical protein AB7K24_16670 [Gemmataceae bacterium]